MRRLLRRFLTPYKGRALIGILTKVIEVIFECLTPLVLARMIDVGVATKNVSEIVRLGLVLLVFALVSYGFTLICQKMAALVSQGMGTDIRQQVFDHIMSFAGPEQDLFGAPTLLTRTTNDVLQIQVAVALGIRQSTRWPLLAAGSIIACLSIDYHLGLITLVCMPVVGIIFYLVMSRVLPYYRRLQAALDQLSLLVREHLSGIRPIRAFRQDAHAQARFSDANNTQTSIAVDSGKLSALLSPATMVVMDLGIIAILTAGGIRINAGSLSQGELMAYINYMTTSLISIGYLANLLVIFMRGAASASRIMEVLDHTPAIRDGSATPLPLELVGTSTPTTSAANKSYPSALSLQNISFAYGTSATPALAHVSLDVPQHTTLGIIGGTGSGKSTLAKLLVRLYDPAEGTIELFGHPTCAYPLAQLRSLVGYVPQEHALLAGTIRSNLLWKNPHATDDELWEALRTAQAAEFVAQKPLGLDTPVEAAGANFSGGQRQRLTIARALVSHPPLLVLDDCASALDFATDAKLRSALATLDGQPARIIISQRISAVRDADQILVLHHGAVAGLGTHADLMASCELYQQIYASQLKGPSEVAHA